MIREELRRLFTVEERHQRLLARLLLAFGATVVVFVVGAVLIWALEDGHKGGLIADQEPGDLGRQGRRRRARDLGDLCGDGSRRQLRDVLRLR